MGIKYTERIKSAAKDAKDLALDKLLEMLLAQWGAHNLCEWLAAFPRVSLYFDADGTYDPQYADSDGGSFEMAVFHLMEQCRNGVAAFLEDQPTFDPASVIYATSHGTGDGHRKMSIRVFVPGFFMAVDEIKIRLARLGLDSKHGGVFDPAPYGKNQKLRMPGSIKGDNDRRVLVLLSPEGIPYDGPPPADVLARAIVQNVPEGAVEVTEGATQQLLKVPRAIPQQVQAVEEVTEQGATGTAQGSGASQAVVPAPKRQKQGRPCKADTLPPEWRSVLENLGFSNLRSKGMFQDENRRGPGYRFDADNRRDCPCCHRAHDNNNWYIIRPSAGVYMVKSHSEHCRFRSVSPHLSAEEQIATTTLTLSDKMMSMGVDVDLDAGAPGELHYHRFACTRRECLACADEHGSSACDYALSEEIQGAAWKLRNTAHTCRGTLFHSTSLLPSFLSCVIAEPSCTSLTQLYLAANRDILWTEPTLQDIRIWGGSNWQRVTPKEFGNLAGDFLVFILGQTRQMDAFSGSAKQLKEAFNMCKAPAQQQALAQKILSTQSLACRKQAFDTDPWLLGCDDCIIDLRTGVARAARREDMVSISTGFSFLDADRDIAPIDALMQKVYPVEDERQFIQSFAGYCLSGSCSEKLMLCCTDRRGGSNGKTTLKTILSKALGHDRYLKEGQKELLYQSNNVRDINAHDAGKLAYEFKRCVVFDEMTSKRSLDNGVVKEFTSGDAHPSVRAAFGTTTRSMTWTAKFILIFNEGECPQLRAEDDALMARMVVVQHRAKFCRDEATYERHRSEQHTWMAEDINAIITPQRALAWGLAGLEIYRREGFRRLPDSFRHWREELMLEHDDVAAWASSNIEASDGQFFLLKEALASFALQNTKLGRNHFSGRLQKLFPGAFYKKKRVPPANDWGYGVFYGYRLL